MLQLLISLDYMESGGLQHVSASDLLEKLTVKLVEYNGRNLN